MVRNRAMQEPSDGQNQWPNDLVLMMERIKRGRPVEESWPNRHRRYGICLLQQGQRPSSKILGSENVGKRIHPQGNGVGREYGKKCHRSITVL